jgi:signal transduction histidine kinase
MRFGTLVLLLFIKLSLFSQQEGETFYDQLSTYSHPTSEEKSIDEIISLQENGSFTFEKEKKVYQNLGDKTLWYTFTIKPQENKEFKYFCMTFTYLQYGKVYYKNGDEITALHQTSNSKNFPHQFIFYRNPVWKIPTDNQLPTQVFLELKNNSGRSQLEFYLETENQFLERVETEYMFFGLYISILISMTLILLFFSFLKKEYIVIFYAIYVITALVEFLAGKGLGVQLFWSQSDYFINNSRSLSQTIGTLVLGLFYMKFYTFENKNSLSKNIFKWGSYATIPLLLVYLYKFFFDGLTEFYLIVWTILKVIILVWVLNHLYLAIKKQIPFYLMIAFVLPILAVVNGQIMNPSVHNTLALKLNGPSIYYIFLTLEIILFTRYIFSSVIDTQLKYFKLKKVNDELKYSFQNKTMEVQQQERNNLLSNVHDSFGGYLEALKLRLLQKNEDSPDKIREILDAFNKEYRYLLNNLYSPKINADNFIESLVEYCEKINKLVNHKIDFHFKIENIELSQEKCVHLYRIISELTTNAIKHAKASEIKIRMYQIENKTIKLNINDNGIGFDTKKANINSYGLKNTYERVELMKGSIEISSQKNNGTQITLFIPEND